jgi:hypothetical protein
MRDFIPLACILFLGIRMVVIKNELDDVKVELDKCQKTTKQSVCHSSDDEEWSVCTWRETDG